MRKIIILLIALIPVFLISVYMGWHGKPRHVETPQSLPLPIEIIAERSQAQIDAAKKRPGLYIHLHSNPWFQGMAQDLPNRFELGGDGTIENPGVRWYFDSIGGIRK